MDSLYSFLAGGNGRAEPPQSQVIAFMNAAMNYRNKIRSSLAVPDIGAGEEHLLARTSFLNNLLAFPLVVERRQRWMLESGMAASLDRCFDSLDALQLTAGLSSRLAVWETYLVDDAEYPASFERLVDQVEADVLGLFDPKIASLNIGRQAIAFVRDELQLQWPWAAAELIDDFFFGCLAAVIGVPLRVSYSLGRVSQPAPQIDMTFRTSAGESLEAARERWVAFCATGDAQFAGALPSLHPGKHARGAKHPERAPIVAYAYWLYLRQVERQSVRRIAIATGRDRRHVQIGLQRATAVLSAVSYPEFRNRSSSA